jgi:rhamnulokinase
MGLWVAQECRRDRQAEGLAAEWGELAAWAEASPGIAQAIRIDDQRFYGPSKPGDRMIDRVRAACAAEGLPCADDGALFRRLFEALAAAYARGIEAVTTVTGERPQRLAMVGGGCRNRLLCRLTAERTGLPVTAGPEEGTALGNALIQAKALNLVAPDQFPSVVAASCEVQQYGVHTASA